MGKSEHGDMSKRQWPGVHGAVTRRKPHALLINDCKCFSSSRACVHSVPSGARVCAIEVLGESMPEKKKKKTNPGMTSEELGGRKNAS